MIATCPDLSVPMSIMQHVVQVESSGNPYAIGVVKGRLSRQPRNLAEALAAVKMLESKGYNFSVGIAQVNRYNLKPYGLHSYEQAFQVCPNLRAGTKILKECYDRSKHWGKAFSCYYSGNFVTGYRHGYVQKVTASMQRAKLAKVRYPNQSSSPTVITVITNKKNVAQKKTQPKFNIAQARPTQVADKANYAGLKNQTEPYLIPKKQLITSDEMVTPLSATPNATPNTETVQQQSIRTMGRAEITPQVYTDSAFVF